MGAGKVIERTGSGIRKGGKAVRKQPKAEDLAEYSRRQSRRRRNPLGEMRRRSDEKKTQRLQAQVGDDVDVKKIKTTAKTLYWISLCVITPVVSIFSGLYIYMFDMSQRDTSEAITDVATAAISLDIVDASVQAISAVASRTEWWESYMLAFWFFGFITTAAFLLVSFDILRSQGANTRNGIAREAFFTMALLGSVFPFVNFIPWTAAWLWVIKRKPV